MSCGKNEATGFSLDQEKTGTSDRTPDSISAKDFRKVTCKLGSLHFDPGCGHHNQGDEHQSIDSHVQTKIDEAVDGDSAKANGRSKTDSAGKVICAAQVH